MAIVKSVGNDSDAPKERGGWWRYSLLTAAALAAALGGLWVGVSWEPDTELGLETGKILVQALLAGALGAVAAVLVDLVKRWGADREASLRHQAASRERRLSFELTVLRHCLRRLDSAYRHVKATRRRLKAAFGEDYKGQMPKAEFRTVMCSLSEQSQLDLEQLEKDAETLTSWLEPLALVKKPLGEMETYLGQIWAQVEDVLAVLPDPVVMDDPPDRLLRIRHLIGPANADDDKALAERSPDSDVRSTETAAANTPSEQPEDSDWHFHRFSTHYRAARHTILGAIAERQVQSEPVDAFIDSA